MTRSDYFRALFFCVVGLIPLASLAQVSSLTVMSRNTGYDAQAVITGSDDLPMADIEAYRLKGLAVTDIYGCESHYTTVLSRNSKLREQQKITMGNFPAVYIADQAKNGDFVTHVGYKNGLWTALLSKGSGITDQKILTDKRKFPTEQVSNMISDGYRLTEVCFGDNLWVAILSKGTNWGEQVLIDAKRLNEQQIADKLAQGYAITDINAGAGFWLIVFTKNTGLQHQIFNVSDKFPADWVKDNWAKGFRVTEVFNEGYASKQNEIQTFPNIIKLIEDAGQENAEWFKKFITAYAPSEDAFVAVQRLAGYAIHQKQFEEAANIFARYSELFPDRKNDFEKIIGLLRAENDTTIKIVHLPNTVNTPAQEYLPIPTADGSGLYFTAYNRGNRQLEDIYYSPDFGGGFSKAFNLGAPLNTKSNEAAIAVSPDGNRLFLYGNFPGSLGNGDIFYADKIAMGWSAVQHFDSPINSEYFDSGLSLSSDGNAMFIVSDRPGAKGEFKPKDFAFHGSVWGNLDIYVCLKTPSGAWGSPINLGEVINTPFAERSPFLHPDGKTLYFSSDGHAGLGRLDVFKCTRLKEDSWTEWSEPVNLGKQINTMEDDYGFIITTLGGQAFFSSSSKKDSYGENDIYALNLPKVAQPNPVAAVSGKIIDEAGNPISAEIKIEDLHSGKPMGTLNSDPQNGHYFIALPLGKNYGYYVQKEGYYPVSENLNLENTDSEVVVNQPITLRSIDEMVKNHTAIRINNLFFDTDSAVVKPESYPELDRLATMLKNLPRVKVEISGHTDNLGADEYNRSLSELRAKAVCNYLISKGLSADIITFKGYGEEKPVADNADESGRALNRRVEFQFVN